MAKSRPLSRPHTTTSAPALFHENVLQSDDLLGKLYNSDTSSLSKLVSIVMEHKKWSIDTFIQKTGYSVRTYNRLKADKHMDENTVFTFIWAAGLTRTEAEFILIAAHIPLFHTRREDDLAVAHLLDEYRGQPAHVWNAYLAKKGVKLRIKEPKVNA
jgi:hypothetical protein